MAYEQRRTKITEQKLKRRSPIKGNDLEHLARRLHLNGHTAAVEEAITILLLITEGSRRSFLLEEADGSIIRINL
jgi:hypothetical protein